MTEKTRTRAQYYTIRFDALPPGWRNVFDIDGELMLEPCPGVLTQEIREIEHCTDIPRGDGKYRLSSRTEKQVPPYETVAVFADVEDGELCPARDVSNYVETIAPGASPTSRAQS